MGNKQPKTILDKWNEHIRIKNLNHYNQAEFFEYYNPQQQIKIAIEEMNRYADQQKLQSYTGEVITYLKIQDPNKYVGAIAVQVFLGQTYDTDFTMPVADNNKEKQLFLIIAKHEMIKDILKIWDGVFENKYVIFQEGKNIQAQLMQQSIACNFVYQSMCNDILFFMKYLENVLLSIFKIEKSDNFQKLVIKMIMSKNSIKTIITSLFEVYCNQETLKFKTQLLKYQQITLEQLKVSDKFCFSTFKNTIQLLTYILKSDHPCDKFELCSEIDAKMTMDIQLVCSDPNLNLDIDNQIGILTYCIIKINKPQWISQINLIEKFLGDEIHYNRGKLSVQFTNLITAIRFILHDLDKL